MRSCQLPVIECVPFDGTAIRFKKVRQALRSGVVPGVHCPRARKRGRERERVCGSESRRAVESRVQHSARQGKLARVEWECRVEVVTFDVVCSQGRCDHGSGQMHSLRCCRARCCCIGLEGSVAGQVGHLQLSGRSCGETVADWVDACGRAGQSRKGASLEPSRCSYEI